MTSLRTIRAVSPLTERAEFAAEHPECLHSPAMYREMLAGLLAECALLRAGLAVAVARALA